MDRRKFIEAGAALATLAAAEAGFAAGTPSFGGSPVSPGNTAVNRFAFGYHPGTPGGYWVDATARPIERVPQYVDVFLLGVQGVSAGLNSNPLRRFEIDLLYRMSGAGGNTAPYRWANLTRVGIGGLTTSKAITHRVKPDQLAGLAIGYDWVVSAGKSKRETQSLAWTNATVPLLTPGFYVLAGPQASGLPPSWGALAAPVANRCLVGRCDGRATDFDAILIAVEPA